MTNQVRLTLLDDTDSTGAAKVWPGGKGLLTVEGTTPDVQLQIESANGTWLDVGSNVTADGVQEFDLPPGQIRGKVNSGSAIFAYAVKIPTY